MLWRLFRVEFVRALRNWQTYLPSVLGGTLALFFLTFGFSRAAGADLSRIVGSGWLMFATVSSALGLAATAILDLGFARAPYYLGLPVSAGWVVAIRLAVGTAVAGVATTALALVALVLGVIPAEKLPWVVVLVMFQALGITGLVLLPSYWLRDLTGFALVASVLISALQYASPVFFPMDVFPVWSVPLLYLNPLTPTVNLIRASAAAPLDIVAVLLAAGAYGGIGWAILRGHLTRHAMRLRVPLAALHREPSGAAQD